MKVTVIVCCLLAAASGQLIKPHVLEKICKDTEQEACQVKATKCAEARRDIEINKTYITIMRTCAGIHNIDRESFTKAVDAVINGTAGQIYDILQLDEETKKQMRLCGLRRGNMLNNKGMPNVVKIKSYLKLRILMKLFSKPQMRAVMEDALNSCPIVSDVNATDDFRYCMLDYCVINLHE